MVVKIRFIRGWVVVVILCSVVWWCIRVVWVLYFSVRIRVDMFSVKNIMMSVV